MTIAIGQTCLTEMYRLALLIPLLGLLFGAAPRPLLAVLADGFGPRGYPHRFPCLVPYAPVRVFQVSADEEVSPKRSATLVDKSRASGGDIELTLCSGATHDFDDPGTERRSNPANVAATADAMPRAAGFFAGILSGN